MLTCHGKRWDALRDLVPTPNTMAGVVWLVAGGKLEMAIINGESNTCILKYKLPLILNNK